jgi:hypothetical protein
LLLRFLLFGAWLKGKKKIPVLYAYLSVKTLLLRGIEVWFSSLKC